MSTLVIPLGIQDMGMTTLHLLAISDVLHLLLGNTVIIHLRPVALPPGMKNTAPEELLRHQLVSSLVLVTTHLKTLQLLQAILPVATVLLPLVTTMTGMTGERLLPTGMLRTHPSLLHALGLLPVDLLPELPLVKSSTVNALLPGTFIGGFTVFVEF